MISFGNEYKDAKANTGDFVKLPAGGYVARITAAEYKLEDKPYLLCTYDIAEGEYKGYYDDDFGKEHPYAHQFRQYNTPKSAGAFKGFLRNIDMSNGTNFVKTSEETKALNEQELVGKLIGIVIAYKERANDRGEIREVSFVDKYRTVDGIRQGRFKVPELVKLPQQPNTPPEGFENVSADDLPFF